MIVPYLFVCKRQTLFVYVEMDMEPFSFYFNIEIFDFFSQERKKKK